MHNDREAPQSSGVFCCFQGTGSLMHCSLMGKKREDVRELSTRAIVVKSVPGTVPVFCLERNVPVLVYSGVPFRFCTVHIN